MFQDGVLAFFKQGLVDAISGLLHYFFLNVQTLQSITLQGIGNCIFFPHTRNVKLTEFSIKKLQKLEKL